MPRKVAFSCKAKRQQLQARKHRQSVVLTGRNDSSSSDERAPDDDDLEAKVIRKLNKRGKNDRSLDKYTLQFFQETKAELAKGRKLARTTIEPVSLKDQEVSDNYFPPELDMPKRPQWDYSISREQLEIREHKYFTEYLKNLEKLHITSYFELNLETWRQLWRVLEMSDVLLMVIDIRFPVLMFPPYLYRYVTEELDKQMIIVLNKIDLVPPALVVAWKSYFCHNYPKLFIVLFTSYPAYNLRGNVKETEGIKRRRRRGKLKMAVEGAFRLYETCKQIVQDDVDLSSWHDKIQEEMQSDFDLDDADHKDNVTIEKADTSYVKHERYKNGVLTIGCIGTPNVGKSSLINALMGKTVVSVSRTPGHTKHFQTIFLTKNVCLCDCPGLVFPSTVPKKLQILMGSFPIAQVREPYTSVMFLAERIDLPKILNIKHPENCDTWSAMDICDGWALKRNFITARTGRPDTYRAANSLLRMALEGKISINIYPPGWADNKEKFEEDSYAEVVTWILAKNKVQDADKKYASSEDEDDDDDEEEEEEEEEEGPRAGEVEEDEESGDSNDAGSGTADLPRVVNKFAALSADL